MSQNIEIKAYCENPKKTRQKIRSLSVEFIGIDQQKDTYFNTKSGRFKLRESSLSGNYLIPYLRSDQHEPGKSSYQKIPVESVAETLGLFDKLLGIRVKVEKKREIYLYENVRIHLDEVEGLGSFVELEAVMDEKYNSVLGEEMKIRELMNLLAIKEEDLISVSYENLILEKFNKNI